MANRETTSVREFQQGLRDLGYIEGKNILFEYRYTEGNLDRVPSLVSELVQLKVDVLRPFEFSSDPGGQASNPDDSCCDGNYAGSSRDRHHR